MFLFFPPVFITILPFPCFKPTHLIYPHLFADFLISSSLLTFPQIFMSENLNTADRSFTAVQVTEIRLDGTLKSPPESMRYRIYVKQSE